MNMYNRFSLLCRLFSLAVVFVFLFSCTKDPYEVEIERFYFESMKKSVSIVTVTVDTTVTYDQAEPWLEKKLERVKQRLKASYAGRYNEARSTANPDAVLVAQWKAKLDSAEAGLYSANNHEIKTFGAFVTEKPRFEQLTLKYKTWVQGEVREQVFIRRVTSTDTTLSVTEKGVREYLMY